MRDDNEFLRSVLESQRAWVRHWQKDGECNLKPTPGSLASALAEIELALAATAQPIGHNYKARLEAVYRASLGERA